MAIGKYLNINHNSGTPVYRQVMDQVKKAVATGDIKPDEKLPTIRELAALLKINPNTIAKVYNELERENIIYKRQGMGTFIAAPIKPVETMKARKTAAVKAASEFLMQTWPLQLRQDDLRQALQEAADALNLEQNWIDDEVAAMGGKKK